jgi:hypothetical protein
MIRKAAWSTAAGNGLKIIRLFSDKGHVAASRAQSVNQVIQPGQSRQRTARLARIPAEGRPSVARSSASASRLVLLIASSDSTTRSDRGWTFRSLSSRW